MGRAGCPRTPPGGLQPGWARHWGSGDGSVRITGGNWVEARPGAPRRPGTARRRGRAALNLLRGTRPTHRGARGAGRTPNSTDRNFTAKEAAASYKRRPRGPTRRLSARRAVLDGATRRRTRTVAERRPRERRPAGRPGEGKAGRRGPRCTRPGRRIGCRNESISPTGPAGELVDYEAAGLSTQAVPKSGSFSPSHVAHSDRRGRRGDYAPTPRPAAGRSTAPGSAVRRRVALDYSGCGTRPHGRVVPSQ